MAGVTGEGPSEEADATAGSAPIRPKNVTTKRTTRRAGSFFIANAVSVRVIGWSSATKIAAIDYEKRQLLWGLKIGRVEEGAAPDVVSAPHVRRPP